MENIAHKHPTLPRQEIEIGYPARSYNKQIYRQTYDKEIYDKKRRKDLHKSEKRKQSTGFISRWDLQVVETS